MSPREPSAGINDYKPFAPKFLADYRIYADWKKLPPAMNNAEQIQTALKVLHDSQNQLQLRGRLNDVYKEEETKLTRRLAEIQKTPH